MTLGQKLKQTRLARGMTQSQVVGDRITRNMLSQIENDLASPSVGTLEYLASVLNVRLSWLLADEQDEAEAERTQQLRDRLKRGDYAACLDLAPEHAPDDEQALALAMAAVQCAQRALEAERFDTARHLAQQGLSWNAGSVYESTQLSLDLQAILARCAQHTGLGQEESAFADYRQAYAAQRPRARYHLTMARYQLERGKTVAAEAELRAVSTPPEEDRAEYRMKQNIRRWFQELLELLFQSAGLVIDTIRTFFLIVLSILGPIAFAISVYDGFQSTLTQWITRYISVYMWLPVSDLFSSVLARIQVLMLTKDIEAMSDPTFIPDSSNTVYMVFLIIGIFGYFTIPTVANWIIMAGGVSGANRAMNTTAAKAGNVAAAGAGAAVGNVAGKLIK